MLSGSFQRSQPRILESLEKVLMMSLTYVSNREYSEEFSKACDPGDWTHPKNAHAVATPGFGLRGATR